MNSKKKNPEGLLGRKLGMTQVFASDGSAIPVTAIEVGPCYVLQLRTKEKDGYSGVQLGFVARSQKNLSKADIGRFKKSGEQAYRFVKEIKCDVDRLGWGAVGQQLKVGDLFESGELVDVSGISIGKGFAGVVKRHGMKGQPATRGTHEYRRHVGSIGCRKFPGRVHKNKRMPGRMGNVAVTIQNLRVVQILNEENVILVKGGVPGFEGQFVVVKKAAKGYQPKVKTSGEKQAA
ncbi:MAG TPA: 50S ribosomal protein L3 [Oligoflexia bacterium]|nr:50S ribosomal protein L3 [Oligoflexia bacterium]HMP26498.1 50S ribosomal protein L3 [Oligoflexia bacterium]